MASPPPLIRRVRSSDLDDLKKLCNKDIRWSKYYRSHPSWLSHAIEEFNERIVFGAFKYVRNGDIPQYKLNSCIFLKRSGYSSTMELKGLTIPGEDSELGEDDRVVLIKLLKRIVRFVGSIGIERISTEVPEAERGIISCFLHSKFSIIGLREIEIERKGCLLERNVDDTYFGDPFDLHRIAKWITRAFIPCSFSDAIEDANTITFPFFPNASSTFSENQIGLSKRLKGYLYVPESIDYPEGFPDKIEVVESEKPAVHIAFADIISDDLKKDLNRAGVHCFTLEDAQNFAGKNESTLGAPFTINETAGAITVLERDAIDKLGKLERFPYFLLSGLYIGVRFAYNEQQDGAFLFFFCPNYDGSSAGIVGYSTINFYSDGPAKEVLKKQVELNPVIATEDLGLYKKFKDNETVALLECSKIIFFEKPATLDDRSWVSSDAVVKYLKSELEDFSSNTAYIDLKSYDGLLKNSNIAVTNSPKQGEDMRITLAKFLRLKLKDIGINSGIKAVSQSVGFSPNTLRNIENPSKRGSEGPNRESIIKLSRFIIECFDEKKMRTTLYAHIEEHLGQDFSRHNDQFDELLCDLFN